MTSQIFSLRSLTSAISTISTISTTSSDETQTKHGIYKSKYDTNDYKFMKLPNGLSVLLISDPKTAKSAASITVGVGHHSDGDIEGVAHYLEHMLFMGSDEYPDEDYYHTFIVQCGGKSNAYTSYDHTNYHFYVESTNFPKALHVFAQFFIAPKMYQKSLEKEMNAVHNEHQKNLMNDGWRSQEMMRMLGEKGKPFASFSTGCLETLNIPNIREKTLNFYNTYYSPNIMTLVIFDSRPIQELEKIVAGHYNEDSIVQSQSQAINDKYVGIFTNPLFKNKNVYVKYNFDKLFENKSSYVEMIPIKNDNVISLMWDIEDKIQNYGKHIIYYLCHLIGHEAPNTLTDILKNLSWIKSLSSGTIGNVGGRTIFQINITLTDYGMHNIQEIIALTLDYIEIVKQYGISSLYFDEMQQIAYRSFIFSDQPQPIDIVTYLSSRINKLIDVINPSNILKLSSLYEPFVNAKDDIEKTISCLTKDNMTVFFSSKNFKNCTGKQEKWYGIDYNIYDNLNRLNLDSVVATEKLRLSLCLPTKNEYMPKNFDIVTSTTNQSKNPIKFIESNVTVYFKPNSIKILPLCSVTCIITSEYLNSSNISASDNAIRSLLAALYIGTWEKMMNGIFYICNIASYKLDISKIDNKIVIFISGYRDKFQEIINLFIDSLTNKVLDETIYESYKLILQKSLENNIFVQPYERSRQLLCKKIHHKLSLPEIQLENLKTITFDDVSKTLKNILQMTSVKCLCTGNLTESDALIIAKKFSVFSSHPQYQPTIEYPIVNNDNTFLVNKINNLTIYNYFNTVNNIQETNSAIAYIIKFSKIDYNSSNWAKYCVESTLLNSIISTRFFDKLRTQYQLGYIAKSQEMQIGSTEKPLLAMILFVQSSDRSSSFLNNCTKLFLDNVINILTKLSKEDFKMYIESEINTLSNPFNSYNEENDYYTEIVLSGSDNFNKNELLIDQLKIITINDLINTFKNKYQSGEIFIVGLDGNGPRNNKPIIDENYTIDENGYFSME
jgi:insulysin